MASAYITVSDETFEEAVLKSEKPVVVDFWAEWCRPCLMMAPTFEELAGEYTDKLTFAKLDTEANEETMMRYRVESLPTLMFFANGAPVVGLIGYRSRADLKQNIDHILAEIASQTA